MTPEGRIRAYLRKRALAAGLEHRKLRWIGRRGAPDELLFAPDGGRSAGVNGGAMLLHRLVEVKAPGVNVDWDSPQGREINRLRNAGWLVSVVNTIEQADAVIDDLLGWST